MQAEGRHGPVKIKALLWPDDAIFFSQLTFRVIEKKNIKFLAFEKYSVTKPTFFSTTVMSLHLFIIFHKSKGMCKQIRDIIRLFLLSIFSPLSVELTFTFSLLPLLKTEHLKTCTFSVLVNIYKIKNLIVEFGQFTGFIDNNKNIEYYLIFLTFNRQMRS